MVSHSKCFNCGEEVKGSAKFCSNCGCNLSPPRNGEKDPVVGESTNSRRNVIAAVVIISAVILASFVFYYVYQSKKHEQEQLELEKQALESQLKSFLEERKASSKKWSTSARDDPASGVAIISDASIVSTNGMCSLRVEKRIDGSELTDFSCLDESVFTDDDINIKKAYDGEELTTTIMQSEGVDVKFDTHETSERMALRNYSNSLGVYITKYPKASDRNFFDLNYSDFIEGLKTSEAVAIKYTTKSGSHWVRFTLNGAEEAINSIGTPSEDF